MFSKYNQFLQQILNSAPLNALSPDEAIKSRLIPSLHHYMRGGGANRATTQEHRPRTNTLPGHKAGPQEQWSGIHSVQTEQNSEGLEHTSLRLWPLSNTPCGTICKSTGLWKSVGPSAPLPGPLTALSPHCSCCREESEHHFHSAHATGFHSCGNERDLQRARWHMSSNTFAHLSRACILQQQPPVDENYRKPANSLSGWLERAAPFLATTHQLTTLTIDTDITSCE